VETHGSTVGMVGVVGMGATVSTRVVYVNVFNDTGGVSGALWGRCVVWDGRALWDIEWSVDGTVFRLMVLSLRSVVVGVVIISGMRSFTSARLGRRPWHVSMMGARIGTNHCLVARRSDSFLLAFSAG
jgi:hypothetical protein